MYTKLDVPTDGYLDFYIWPEYAKKGYLWMIPKCDGRANVGLVSEAKKGIIKDLDSFIENTHFSNLEVVNPPWREDARSVRGFGGTIPISGPHERTYADGLLLLVTQHIPLLHCLRVAPILRSTAAFAAETAAAVSQQVITRVQYGALSGSMEAALPPYEQILKGKTALYNPTDDEMSLMGCCFPQEMSAMGPHGKAMVGLRLLFRKPSLYFRRTVLPCSLLVTAARSITDGESMRNLLGIADASISSTVNLLHSRRFA